jgi:hypothetical protein
MTIATMPGTYLGGLGQPGDYVVNRPNDAWSGAGAFVQVLVEYADSGAGISLWQRGRDVGAAAYTHERARAHGAWSDWATIGAVTLPGPQAVAPTISDLDPVTIDDDGLGQVITINGTGFVRGCVVEVSNSAAVAGAVTFTSDTVLAITLDTAHASIVAPETLSFVVVNPDGKRSNVALLPVETP